MVLWRPVSGTRHTVWSRVSEAGHTVCILSTVTKRFGTCPYDFGLVPSTKLFSLFVSAQLQLVHGNQTIHFPEHIGLPPTNLYDHCTLIDDTLPLMRLRRGV